jgi:hypothetical protein
MSTPTASYTDRLRQTVDGLNGKPVDLFNGPPISLTPPPPPELEPGLFPPWVDDMIFAVAESTETPPILAGTFAIAALAAAAQGRFVVNPTLDYFEELCFWAACGMPPGSRKTAVMLKMAGPLYAWQREKADEFRDVIRKAEAEDGVARARLKRMREAAVKEDDAAQRAVLMAEADEQEAKLQPIPVTPRLLTEDCTPEHTATMLKAHGERLSIFSDEGGVLDLWGGRYSNGIANLDVYLKSHSGSPVIVDRGSRPSVLLDRPTLSIGIAPQPSVIGALVNNSIFRNRGAVARFFLFLPTSMLGFRTLDTTPVPEFVANEYANHLKPLIELPPAPDSDGGHKPRRLRLSGDAYHAWKAFGHEVELMMRPDGPLERLTDWTGKLPGAAARVAGLFHVAHLGVEAVREDEIELDTMNRALAFSRFAIPHTKAVFEGLDESGAYEDARRLWRTCERGRHQRKDPGVVTLRELWHPNRGTFKETSQIEPAVRVLIDHGWLVELESADKCKRGRPSRSFKINPAALAGTGSGHSGHRA